MLTINDKVEVSPKALAKVSDMSVAEVEAALQLLGKHPHKRTEGCWEPDPPRGKIKSFRMRSVEKEYLPQLEGKYQVTSIALFDKNNKPIPNSLIFPTNNNVYKIRGIATNLVSYKLKITNDSTPIKLEDIAKITASISFIPYQIEKISLPVNDKVQSASSQNKDFTVDISPTHQAKVYLLHWHAKDKVIFKPQLMNGADNALIQFILPDNGAWLTPAETRIINSIPYGFENRIKIAFTTAPPQHLDLYIIRENSSKANATTRTITFSRN